MDKKKSRFGFLLGICATLFALPVTGEEAVYSELVRPGADGELVYKPYTERGDVIPDFSHCGYGGGGVKLPHVAVKVALEPGDGSDDLVRIQAAIDSMTQLPLDADGFRGAVLLRKGTYNVGGTLEIRTGGIVLRGEGDSESGTVLVATRRKRHDLIQVRGSGRWETIPETRQEIVDAYVPLGARRVTVADGSVFRAGETVLVLRRGNAEWIHEIGMDRIKPRPRDPESTRQWRPFRLQFDRVVTGVSGNVITVDAPITCAIDAQWGGGEVVKYVDRRIDRVGIEHMMGISVFDSTKTRSRRGRTYFSDEDHASNFVRFDNVTNAWVRNVTIRHFDHGYTLGRGAKWVTVQECAALEPVSILRGSRRYPFHHTGQLNLFWKCKAVGARHAFVVGSRVPGPNVFLDCTAEENYGSSEPHHRWSVGGLYDNVHARIAIVDRQHYGTGHGWAGANYVAWNCEGTLACESPPTARNFAIGFVGRKVNGPFDGPDGYWESLGQHVNPRSLYLQQLEDRLGAEAVANMTD